MQFLMIYSLILSKKEIAKSAKPRTFPDYNEFFFYIIFSNEIQQFSLQIHEVKKFERFSNCQLQQAKHMKRNF